MSEKTRYPKPVVLPVCEQPRRRRVHLSSKEFPKEQQEGGTRSDTAQGSQGSGLWGHASRHRAMRPRSHTGLLRRGGESEHRQRRRSSSLALRAKREGGDSQAPAGGLRAGDLTPPRGGGRWG